MCRTITLRKDKFDEREEDFYEALYTQSQAQFATYVQSGTVVNNYAHIFDLLIRLRQVSRDTFLLPLLALLLLLLLLLLPGLCDVVFSASCCCCYCCLVCVM